MTYGEAQPLGRGSRLITTHSCYPRFIFTKLTLKMEQGVCGALKHLGHIIMDEYFQEF